MIMTAKKICMHKLFRASQDLKQKKTKSKGNCKRRKEKNCKSKRNIKSRRVN